MLDVPDTEHVRGRRMREERLGRVEKTVSENKKRTDMRDGDAGKERLPVYVSVVDKAERLH